jgi:glucan phosphoethanolaminetransferase (alkaline phosphatase superfamily)
MKISFLGFAAFLLFAVFATFWKFVAPLVSLCAWLVFWLTR